MSHSDRPDPEAVILANGDTAASVEQVLGALKELGIEHQTTCHEPLYIVEQAKSVVYKDPGAHTKNLFLRNKKGRMFLLVVERDHTVDLRGLRDRLKVTGGQFAFASTERLGLYLGVVPGSVSPLALINDTHSTRLRTADLLRALEAWSHTPTALHF